MTAGFFPADPDEDLCPCASCRANDSDPDDSRPVATFPEAPANDE
jgi:hypothetical protein